MDRTWNRGRHRSGGTRHRGSRSSLVVDFIVRRFTRNAATNLGMVCGSQGLAEVGSSGRPRRRTRTLRRRKLGENDGERPDHDVDASRRRAEHAIHRGPSHAARDHDRDARASSNGRRNARRTRARHYGPGCVDLRVDAAPSTTERHERGNSSPRDPCCWRFATRVSALNPIAVNEETAGPQKGRRVFASFSGRRR